MRDRWMLGVASAVSALALAACGGSSSNASKPPPADATVDSTSTHFDDGGGPDGDMPQVMCDAGCPTGTQCSYGVCEPPQPACVTNAGCQYDTYCNASGQCQPYGTAPDAGPQNDPSCTQLPAPGVFQPAIACEFTQAPAGDPFPMHLDVQATPMVANFNAPQPDGTIIGPPSIVVPFAMSTTDVVTTVGIIRVLQGTDCTLQANLGGTDLDGDGTIDWVNSSSPVAIADLDGDGIPEIVAYMGDLTTVAFTIHPHTPPPNYVPGTWVPLWPKVFATTANGETFVMPGDGALADGTFGRLNGPLVGPCPAPYTAPGCNSFISSGPSIDDLDNDAGPQVIREGYVIDGATGVVRATPPMDYQTYVIGLYPVLADINGDGRVELLNGANIWSFDPVANAWDDLTSYSQMTSTEPGLVAVADFNPYDGLMKPEIVVAAGTTLTIYNLDHSVFMGMSVAEPNLMGLQLGVSGGPPTIADFDNDGLPEVGLAGNSNYTVFDPDCQPNGTSPRPGGKCADRTHCGFAPNGQCPDYILWSSNSQDGSAVTGSSVFDFDGDGTPEAIYADECYARVYSGFDGTVLFSQYHSSATYMEAPVVADVAGNYRSEMIVVSNTGGGPPACGQVDPTTGVDEVFAGTQCLANTDCPSAQCVSGFCRCTMTADCCALNDNAKCLQAGFACEPPPAGTPGTGNTCRAPHPGAVQGLRVFKDANDKWVRSRPIWNQDAYAVTNVNVDGTIPTVSAWAANWTTAGLNNFRQNVPGTGKGNDVGDLTAQAGPFFSCSGGQAVMAEPVCNRGTAPVGAGVAVGFYVGTMQVCTTTTTTALQVGACETVSCTWMTPPTLQAMATNVSVVANDGGHTAVCYANDKGLVENVFCMPPN